MQEQAIYAARREKLTAQLKANDIILIPASKELLRNGDAHYPFRQNSDFFYLTGFNEPDAILVLRVNSANNYDFTLFCNERDPKMEQWVGARAGTAGAIKEFAADNAFLVDEFATKLPELLLGCQRVLLPLSGASYFHEEVLATIKNLQRKVRSGIVAPVEIINSETYLHPMRRVKDEHEIQLLRQAAEISVSAHMKTIQACRPGMWEYELEAILKHEFCRHGARETAYESIVGSGANACVLHYVANNAKMNDGDLVLIDAGCEYQMYASDITRTFPANGRYTAEQKAIYEIVLQAQKDCIAALKPGVAWQTLQSIVITTITHGLVDVGILKGKPEQLIEEKAYQPFYMHLFGHWLGMDVHDAGNYKDEGEWTSMQAGMVTTVEPGIYIMAGMKNVDEKWWNIGIRIEDDILITNDGSDVLTAALPKEISDIEELMK